MSLVPEDVRDGAEQRAAPPVPTPCIGVCWLDEATGLCQGCARTGEEIAAWQAAGDDYKRGVWDALPERRARVGMATYRLPWSAEEIAGFVERSLRQRAGRWVLGLDGASVSFAIAEDEDAEIASHADGVVAITGRGALRIAMHPKAIAIAFGDAHESPPLRRSGLEPLGDKTKRGANSPLPWGEGWVRGYDPSIGQAPSPHLLPMGEGFASPLGIGGPQAIGLVLPRGRVDVRRGDKLAKVGPDVASIAASADAQLYDLGIAQSAASRVCLRTVDPRLIAALDRLEGRNWREALAEIRPLINAPPDVVVETGLGRAERLAANPGPSADRAAFPELPSGWSLPAVFAPCAVFYPHRRRPPDALFGGDF
jgi:predicted Fe-S protein YdhL (DUF1289 family)